MYILIFYTSLFFRPVILEEFPNRKECVHNMNLYIKHSTEFYKCIKKKGIKLDRIDTKMSKKSSLQINYVF